MIQSQIAIQNQQGRPTRARLLVHEMQDPYFAELQRYEKYRREAELSRNSLEAARASFSNWCGPDSP